MLVIGITSLEKQKNLSAACCSMQFVWPYSFALPDVLDALWQPVELLIFLVMDIVTVRHNTGGGG